MNYICKASTESPATHSPDFKGYCPRGYEDAMPGSDSCYKIDMMMIL